MGYPNAIALCGFFVLIGWILFVVAQTYLEMDARKRSDERRR